MHQRIEIPRNVPVDPLLSRRKRTPLENAGSARVVEEDICALANSYSLLHSGQEISILKDPMHGGSELDQTRFLGVIASLIGKKSFVFKWLN